MYEFAILLHLLAATIWTGGHLVLAIGILPGVLKNTDLAFIRAFESAYEKVGIPALIIQILTGVWISYSIWPTGEGLLELASPISKLIAVKLSLLLLTVLFAIDARLRIIPNLTSANLYSLAWHIIPVTIFSVLFAAAGVLFRFGYFN